MEKLIKISDVAKIYEETINQYDELIKLAYSYEIKLDLNHSKLAVAEFFIKIQSIQGVTNE